jgi:hypothetical protein
MTKKQSNIRLRSRKAAPAATHYPAPEERRRILARRDKLLQEFVHLVVLSPNNTQKFDRLIAKYGLDEVQIVAASIRKPRGSFIAEQPRLYRDYRQVFARFGGEGHFMSKAEYEAVSLEYTKLAATRQFKTVLSKRPSKNELEMRDRLLLDAISWPDITPPAAPPLPPDYAAPLPGEYSSTAQTLLKWGPDRDDERIANNARNSKWRRAISDLTRMVMDKGLLEGWPGENDSWAPLHALLMLGEVTSDAADIEMVVPPLFALMERENDWLSDLLPEVWGKIGPAVEPFLWDYLDNRQHHPEHRGNVMMGLKAIAKKNPARCPSTVQRLLEHLQAAPQDDREANAYIIHVLLEMDVAMSCDLILAAFAADKIDTSIIQPYDIH